MLFIIIYYIMLYINLLLTIQRQRRGRKNPENVESVS